MDGFCFGVGADFRRQCEKLLQPIPEQAGERPLYGRGRSRLRRRLHCHRLRVIRDRASCLFVLGFHDISFFVLLGVL